MPDASFIEKLRMNNIFPPEGRGLPNPLIGMPDFYSGRQIPPYENFGRQERTVPIEVAEGYKRGQLGNIGQSMQNEPNVIYRPPESDKYATHLLMGPSAEDKRLQTQLEIAKGKTNVSIQGVGIKQQQIDINKFKAMHPGKKFITTKGGNIQAFDPNTGEGYDTGVDSGTLSDQDKLELTGKQRMGEIGARGDIQKELQGTRGEQALTQIGARIKGQKEIQAGKPMLPSQQKAGEQAAILQIQTTRPDLAKYLVKDPTTGVLAISPDTPMNELSMIQNIINPRSSKDINLPSSGSKGTPTSKTPKANDPLGIR